jgi:effector-binding domain-containing protein
MSEVSIVEIPSHLVVGMRKRGTYADIGEMVATVWRFAAGSGAQIQGRPTFICHETPKEAMKANEQANADVEVVVPVAKKVPGTDRVRCYELPGGPMAKILHQGPCEKSAPAYKALFTWIAEQHKRVVGPTREVYVNDPKKVPPEEILTEIYAPVQ